MFEGDHKLRTEKYADPLDAVTSQIIAAAIDVHREIGPGLLESAYCRCLSAELLMRGLRVDCERSLPLHHRGVMLDCGYRLDMLVEDQVVVEIKSITRIERVHVKQLLTYLRLANRRVGLLFNFNVATLRSGGIRRVVNGYGHERESAST